MYAVLSIIKNICFCLIVYLSSENWIVRLFAGVFSIVVSSCEILEKLDFVELNISLFALKIASTVS